MKQLLSNLQKALRVAASVLVDACGGVLLTCAVMLAFSSFTNGLYKLGVVAAVICIPPVIILFTYRRFLSMRGQSSSAYFKEHEKLLSAPRLFYASMTLFELIFAVLAIHVTLFMNQLDYAHVEQVLSTMQLDTSITEFCAIVRSLPQALTYVLIESTYVTVSTDITDPESIALAQQVAGSIMTVGTIQGCLTVAMWTIYAVSRYPGKVFNHYLTLKKAEEDGVDTNKIVPFRTKKKGWLDF